MALDTNPAGQGNDLDQQPGLKVAVVNRFYPPDGAPTGFAARDLARALAAALPASAAVVVFATDAGYGRAAERTRKQAAAAARDQTELEETEFEIKRLACVSSRRWPPLRLLATLIEGWALARRAARAAKVVITLTDPPFAPLWLGAIGGDRLRVEWTMDLYPEALAAAGQLRRAHPLYRWLERRRQAQSPAAALCLGPGQLAFFRARTGFAGPGFILPAGVVEAVAAPEQAAAETAAAAAAEAGVGTRPLLVYAGNLGRMHRPHALARVIERAAARGCRALLAVHGDHAPALRRRLAPLAAGPEPAVIWRDWLSAVDLAAATAHLVSLAAPATHVCVPSKAASAVCLGRPILFIGSPESDVWTQLGRAGWLIAEQADDQAPADQIEAALDGVCDPAAVQVRAEAARALGAQLRQQWRRTTQELAAWIAAAAAP